MEKRHLASTSNDEDANRPKEELDAGSAADAICELRDDALCTVRVHGRSWRAALYR